MTNHSLDEMYEGALKNLNQTYADFSESRSPAAVEFYSIKLQACIFQYDMCSQMHALLSQKPTGLGLAVSAAGIVQKLFEYNMRIDKLRLRIAAMAEAEGVPVPDEPYLEEKRKYRADFKTLTSWSDIRNKAAHYDEDIAVQVELLRGLDPDQVLAVTFAFLSCNRQFLLMLRELAHGHSRLVMTPVAGSTAVTP